MSQPSQEPTVPESPIPGMNSQPVITITLITSFVSAVFAALVYAWPDVDPNLEKTINGLIIAAWPLVTAAWTWHRVYAPTTVKRIADEQYKAGTPPTEPQPEIPTPPGDA